MTNKLTLEDTFTVAEINTVLASMRGELKNDIKGIKDDEIDINDIEDLSERLRVLTIIYTISDLFDDLVKLLEQGLEKLRDEETIAK